HCLRKIDRIQHNLNTRFNIRIEKYRRRNTHTARSAAARHLAEKVDGVALIGPGEPADITSHQGVFASHYDEARITRTIDGD
ncbi:hypothetical protein SB758_40520, partial [Burkholderia sp. SIMBA_013]